MNKFLPLKWLIYFIFSTNRGLSHASSSITLSNQQANFYNSSPNSYNNGHLLYSSWSQWSTCSSTCGIGISLRTRQCLKNTYNSKGVSIPLCHGEFIEHKLCKLKPCSKDSQSAREQQCSEHNNKIVAGKYVKVWIPANEGTNPCELRCEAKTEQLVYSFGKVANGTPCPAGACLDGRCLNIGCDERLGSDVTLDMCGVCGGRNSTCVHYKDVFQGQPSQDSGTRSMYHEIVSIPVEARNLIIHQYLGKNLLAFQDRNKGIIFNGEQNMNKYGSHYEIAGSPVEYVKSSNLTEELRVKGPLLQELFVLVLLRSPNPGIYYEYWVPKQSRIHGPQYPYQPIKKDIQSTTTPKPTPHTIPLYNTKSFIYHNKRHPTKPAFAYGYGETPYKGQDLPIFRHILSTTTTFPDLSWNKQSFSSPTRLGQSHQNNINIGYHKNVVPAYKPRSLKPETDYYQTFRNVSRIAKKETDYSKELPVQGDSGVTDETQQNLLSDSYQTKKEEIPDLKPDRTGIKINKRVDGIPRKFISNGRLKYSLENKPTYEVYVNKSKIQPPEQLTINILALPDVGKSNTSAKKSDFDEKPRPPRGGHCEPCQRIRNQLKHFCESDFVLRAQVVGYEFLHGETRYELDVLQSYKNNFALLTKEYVWSPDTCRCPKLRQGKEYVLMGKSDNSYKKRESRLLVDKTSFVRTFNLKYARRLQKLRKDEAKKCKKGS